MELLTISSKEGLLVNEHETVPYDSEGLFPQARQNP